MAASTESAEGQIVLAVFAAYLGAQPRCQRSPARPARGPEAARARVPGVEPPPPPPCALASRRAGGAAPGRGRRAMASSVVRATVRAVSKRRIQATRAALTLVSIAGGQRAGPGDRGTLRVREMRHGPLRPGQ